MVDEPIDPNLGFRTGDRGGAAWKKPAAESEQPRRPRGARNGGQYAPTPVSEPEVELTGSVVGSFDTSKAGWELEKRRKAKIEEERLARETEGSEERVLAEMERGLAQPISDDHFIDSDPSSFAPEQKPVVKLGGRMETDASWLYPPSYTDPEQIIDHWSRCILHDSVVSSVEAADRWGRDLAVYEAELQAWSNSTPFVTRKMLRKDPEGAAAISAEAQARHAYVDRIRYGYGIIPHTEYRDVIRLYAIGLQIEHLPEYEIMAIRNREFQLSSGEITTIQETVEKYRLVEIYQAWFGRRKYPRYD